MHRSRLSTLLIDAPASQAGSSTAFWSAARGASPHTPPGEPEFTELPEVARLSTLRAVEVSSWQGCRTLRAPGGHLLCVIPVHSDPATFELAHLWP